MSFYGYKRRGLRLIVGREPLPGRKLELTLECGHKVTRGNHGIERHSTKAVCPTCRRADGADRDKQQWIA